MQYIWTHSCDSSLLTCSSRRVRVSPEARSISCCIVCRLRIRSDSCERSVPSELFSAVRRASVFCHRHQSVIGHVQARSYLPDFSFRPEVAKIVFDAIALATQGHDLLVDLVDGIFLPSQGALEPLDSLVEFYCFSSLCIGSVICELKTVCGLETSSKRHST